MTTQTAHPIAIQPIRAIDPGYVGRLRSYRRALSLVLWTGLAVTLVLV